MNGVIMSEHLRMTLKIDLTNAIIIVQEGYSNPLFVFDQALTKCLLQRAKTKHGLVNMMRKKILDQAYEMELINSVLREFLMHIHDKCDHHRNEMTLSTDEAIIETLYE